eukprot:gene2802-12677_t
MSNHPLPVHMSCFGVSTDVVSQIRTEQVTWRCQPADYTTKFNATRTMYMTQKAAAAAPPKAASEVVVSTARSRPSQPQAPKQTPVAHEVYQAMLNAAASKVPAPRHNDMCSSTTLDNSLLRNSLSTVPTPRHKDMCSSTTLDNSLLRNSLATVTTDFNAIADSSVGGGGLPRPFGRFTASRCGDGKALWERLPRLENVMDKAYGEDSEQEHSPGRQKSQSASSISSPSRLSPTRRRANSVSCTVPSFRSEKLAIVRGEPQTSLETLGKAYSSLRRPDLAPNAVGTNSPGLSPSHSRPQPSSLHWPAASFLADTPSVPPYLRMDCGTGAGKDLLVSQDTVTIGQAQVQLLLASDPHPDQQQQQNSSPTPLSGEQRKAVSSPQASSSSRGGGGAFFLTEEQPEEASPELMPSLSPSRRQSPTAESAPAAQSRISGSHTEVPNHAAQKVQPAFPCIGGPRRVGSLPPEMHLPRRYVPPGR